MRCGARRFVVFQMQFRQLGDIGRDPPRLVFCQQLCCRAATGFAFIIDIGELLPVGVPYNETVGRYLSGPRRRKAALINRAG